MLYFYQERGCVCMSSEAMERLQNRIDALERRMRLDSNDLDYETHLRQKRDLQAMLDRMKKGGGFYGKEYDIAEGG